MIKCVVEVSHTSTCDHTMKKALRVEVNELHAEVKQALRAAKRGREVCGLLVRENGFLRLLPVKNTTKRLGSFEIVPNWSRISLQANRVAAGRVVGTYHSHPASPAEPRPGDIAGTWNRAFMLIIACWGERVRLWQVRGDIAHPINLIRRLS